MRGKGGTALGRVDDDDVLAGDEEEEERSRET